MALQASGQISFSQLATEFSDTAPHSMSEFYKGGSKVPAQIAEETTASDLTSLASTWISRGSQYQTTPRINWSSGSSNYLYYHGMWHDNGGTGRIIRTMKLDKVGLFYFGGSNYVQSASRSATHKVYINDELQHTFTTSANNSSSAWKYRAIYTTSVDDVIKIDCQWGSSGWGSGRQLIVGGSSPISGDPLTFSGYYSRFTPVSVNAGVPTSGEIKLQDFYSGRGT